MCYYDLGKRQIVRSGEALTGSGQGLSYSYRSGAILSKGISRGSDDGGLVMIKTNKEDFLAHAAEYLNRCTGREERGRIDCGGKRCVLVDEKTWSAILDVLGRATQGGDGRFLR